MTSVRRWTRSDTSSDSGCSDSSYRSRSTAPTEHSDRPYLKHHHTADPTCFEDTWEDEAYEEELCDFDDGASVNTYASTHPSTEDFEEDLPYDTPDYEPVYQKSKTTPSTPDDFSRWFPTTRRMFIRHDDSTFDGNMNLQVYTEVPQKGRKVDLTLFHLRMHDLKNREFSLRRYCRESGREVCHSSRKYTQPAAKRPGFHRSMSNALSSLKGKSDSKTATLESLKRHDSGYGSLSEDDLNVEDIQPTSRTRASIPMPTNTTRLEFSNYAHVDVKRRGAKTSKRYGFEYWGTDYAWKRVATQQGNVKQVAYHLVDTPTSSTVAHIIPDIMTPQESRQEEAKGGWVPPCSFYISNQRIEDEKLTDVADVIVATGLIALVDDCIKSRWHQKGSGAQTRFPMLAKSPLKMNMEFVGPKRLVDEVFNRRGTTATRHSTPLRQTMA
ncbi:hypothetical protein G7Y79_00008g025010 [Physcia stellaris]|nr:hypothetical protein G7Y79_00008g025010 [Physcia stellaris]